VSFGGGALMLNFNSGAPANLIKNLNQFFVEAKYKIKAEKSDELGEDTIREKQEKLFREQLASMDGNEILKEALRVFKDSYVAKIEPANQN
jgi:3-oxoacyl-[acyl-carrier-protein] synthase III